MDFGEVDASPQLMRRADGARREQQLIQSLVIAIFRQRPTQAGGGGSFEVAMNGRLTDGTTAGDLVLSQTELESQSQNFLHFAHRQSFLGHSVPSTFQWRPPAAPVVQRRSKMKIS